MTDLAPMQAFQDIPVVPLSVLSRHIACGGPIWPDFDRQVAARHCRDGLPVDMCPERPAQTRALRHPAVWGGVLDPQFGHLVAEQLTRLPQSVRERPDDIYLFATKPGQIDATPPEWIWQVLDWHGVPRRKVRLVDAALSVTDLRVAAQGEMLGSQPTAAAYLDLLDATMARNGLRPDPAAVVFATRAGMVARGLGGHAGESYLADALTRAGVRVIDPGRLGIAEQMAIYAGARALVFSEGSAIHGRQLLGRVAQDIHILRRRPNQSIGASQLAPRCRALHYHASAGRRLGARMRGGGFRRDLTAALYDLDVVFALFGALGHDLRPHWDAAAYHQAVLVDLRGWLDNCTTAPDQLLENLALIADAGFGLDAPPATAALPH